MPNPLCHFEIMTVDAEKARAFYSTVFDWAMDDESMPGYTLINAGAEPTGAVFNKPASAPGPCVNVYFQVDSIDETLATVRGNGGSVLVEKTPIPNVGHFAIFKDPEGIAVGIMQPA
ncbi:MAG: VOC family protein [Planctomycetota bacterium]|jgi:predicted enzyme related to lactoylglutathione lyase